MAPASHMPAPVVSPFTSPCERKMAPAARKATPAVTASMTRIGSVLWPADSRSTPAWISMVMMVNSAAAERRQHVGAQAGRARQLLALETDDGAEADGEQQAGGDDALRKGRVVGIEHPPLPR